MTDEAKQLQNFNTRYADKYGFAVPENYVFRAKKGLSEDIVKEISFLKAEPEWMTDFRLEALRHFEQRPMPNWGPETLAAIDFQDIYYFVRATDRESADWDEVPPEIKETFDKLGIPEAERKFLSGAGAQYESEVVYHKVREDLKEQGVIFLSMDDGLREHPELVREYFGTVIPYNDNKFA
ncbi:MAG: Fe-S cluster assembly protein SufB, partial [Anaerolineae bacterium]